MAKVKRIDHLAIAVRNVEEAVKNYITLLNGEHIRTEILEERAGPVKVAYLRIGENILSLIQSVEEDGFLNKHIEKRGEGMHHLGLEVDNLEEFIRNAENSGYTIALQDEFSNRKEVVLKPKETLGVILQVLEWTTGSDETLEKRIDRIFALKNI